MLKYVLKRFKKQGLKMSLDFAINVLTDIRNNIIESEEAQRDQQNMNNSQNIKNHL